MGYYLGSRALPMDRPWKTETAQYPANWLRLSSTADRAAIGVTWGAVAGYIGGRVDAAMMRFVDILYALPFMIFIILLMVVFGRLILLLFLAIGSVEWLTMARIMRTQVQALRQQEFVKQLFRLDSRQDRSFSSTLSPMRSAQLSFTPH